MTRIFPFVELKKEREYPKAQHIVFYKESKCIRFTYNEFKVFSLEIILKGFHFVEQCYRGIMKITSSSKNFSVTAACSSSIARNAYPTLGSLKGNQR
ncbi:hypothetical protein EVAR_82414_1 [Eumeta japonica]|uniref:Uncharacterized protein n=1 Tax=Eumeta variegata TaxID=151549 RepID=A0A4C1UAB4_EUMVA|nr:hypothetical protein EVAR_82414_1 [Eumeta japonica]